MKYLLFVTYALVAIDLAAADPLRRVSFERIPGKNSVLLNIRNETFHVSFNQKHAWNVAAIAFKDREVGQHSGATGTVIHWDGEAVGTGHGGEVVESATLTLDDQEVPIQQQNQMLFKLSDTHKAREVVLTRRSSIGPLSVHSRFVFPADAAYYLVTQNYEVIEDITSERFAGYKYAFMHMMPVDFTEWRTFRPHGIGRTGHNGAAETKKLRNAEDEINTPFQALACYAPEWRLGIVYAYPQEYAGSNHLLHRVGKDNKFRAMLFRDSGYKKGEKFEFTMQVTPFEADWLTWQERAASIAEPDLINSSK